MKTLYKLIILFTALSAANTYADSSSPYTLSEFEVYSGQDSRDGNLITAWTAGYAPYFPESNEKGKYVVFCAWANHFEDTEMVIDQNNSPNHGTNNGCKNFIGHMKNRHFDCTSTYTCTDYSLRYTGNSTVWRSMGNTFLGGENIGGWCNMTVTGCDGGVMAFTVEKRNITDTNTDPDTDIEDNKNQCQETGSRSCKAIEEYTGEPDCAVGNPINLLTGNKYQAETDFIDRVGGLSWIRTYNSKLAENSYLTGRGWTPPFRKAIADNADNIAIELSDGKRLQFTKVNDVWVANTDKEYTLTVTSTDYEVKTPQQTTLVFNKTSGFMTKEISSDGYTKTYTMKTVTYQLHLFHLLDTIEDSYGRSLTFHYDFKTTAKAINGKWVKSHFPVLKKINFPDGTAVTYLYAGVEEHLKRLVKATYSDKNNQTSVNRQYHYEHSNMPGLLTGITDENGKRYASWAYDEHSRAIKSYHGYHKEKITVDYSTDRHPVVTQKTIGINNVVRLQDTQYSFNRDGQLSYIDGKATSNCVADSSKFYYDDNGFVSFVKTKTSTSAVDRSTYLQTGYVRNERGLIEKEISPALNTSNGIIEDSGAMTIITTWHTIFDLPIERVYKTRDENDALVTVVTETTSLNDEGRLMSYKVTSGNDVQETNYAYTYHDTNSNLKILTLTEKDPNGNRTITTYNDLGQVTSVKNAKDHTITISGYNDGGLPLSITDENGMTTKYTYDWRGNVTKTSINNTIDTDYTYLKNGLLASITKPDGNNRIDYSYNNARHLTKVKETIKGSKPSIVYGLNSKAGDWEKMTVRYGNNLLAYSKHRKLDDKGRVIKETGNHKQAKTIGIGAGDVINTVKDGSRSALSMIYDVKQQLVSKTSADNTTVYYTYDNRGQLETFTDGKGITTQYAYNGFGELLSVSSPDFGFITYLYDDNGNVISTMAFENDNGLQVGLNTTTTTYDALNRPLKQFVNNVQTIEWVYDLDDSDHDNARGRLATVVDDSGTTNYTYTAFGKIDSQTFTPDGTSLNLVTSYTYADGQLEKIQYPSGNKVTFDNQYGDILAINATVAGSSMIKPLVKNIVYLPFTDQFKSLTLGSNDTRIRKFDTDGRIKEVSGVFNEKYSYDAYDNLSAITRSGYGRTMVYDDVDQLTESNGKMGGFEVDYHYSYDKNGNRILKTRYDGELSHDYTTGIDASSNRLTNVTVLFNDAVKKPALGSDYTYDAAGNIIAIEGALNKDFTYDAHNRIKQAVISKP